MALSLSLILRKEKKTAVGGGKNSLGTHSRRHLAVRLVKP